MVRRIDAHTTRITTVAGSPAAYQGAGAFRTFSGDGGRATKAQLSDPEDIAVDRAGTLYIADTRNNSMAAVIGLAR